MSNNVIEFHRPKVAQRTTQQANPRVQSPGAKLADIEDRDEWKQALAQLWANPKNWRTSRHGNRYIVIDDLNICVVVARHEDGGFKWEIRWRFRNETTVSRWIYVGEQIAINEAWDAVVALA